MEQFYSDNHVSIITMEVNEWFFVNLFYLVYNLAWLMFLTGNHYGQVTTTAGHIFELNVQLNITVYSLFMILLVDLEVFPSGMLSEILYTTVFYNYLVAMAGSQIETAVFLKTLNVNTMMTNTAGKIILGMNILSLGLGVIATLVLPSWKVNQKKTEICEFLSPVGYNRFAIPSTLVLVVVLVVIGVSVFRSCQFRKISNNEEQVSDEGAGHEAGAGDRDTLKGAPSQDRLFSIQHIKSDKNHRTLSVEDNLIVEDIELANIERPVLNREEEEHDTPDTPSGNVEEDQVVETPSLDQLSIDRMIQEVGQLNIVNQNDIQCLPGIGVIQTINKYMKNALISMLILISHLPWNLTALYGFKTNSGCENPTFRVMAELSFSFYCCVFLCLPLLIKIKLDRLSE